MVTILWFALLLAVIWSEATAYIARSIGYRTPAGMWAGVFGLPGVVLANWLGAWIGPAFPASAKRTVMLVVNWLFYFTVIQGALSLKRLLWKPPAATRETP